MTRDVVTGDMAQSASPSTAEPMADGQPIGQRTAPLGIVVSAVEGVWKAALPLAAVLFGTRRMEAGMWVALAVGAGIFAINVLGQGLGWARRRYFVGAEDIRVESGVVSREARSVPYERIQDVAIEETLLSRLLGLSVVTFETGAGGGEDLTLAYLTRAEGERLRELVRERHGDLGVAHALSAEGTDEAAIDRGITPIDDRPIFAMGPRRLVIFGLFSFSLAIFAGLLAVAQQFDFLLPFDLWDGDTWRALWGEGNERLAGLGRAGQLIGALGGLVAVIAIGLATGVVTTIMRDWDFRLDRTAKGFRRRRGLFTRTDVVMPVHRVQAVLIGSRWLRRMFGWHSLSFVSLAQDAGAGSHVVAPFAQHDEIDPIVREAGLEPPEPGFDWHRTQPAYWITSAILWSLVIGGIFMVAATIVADRPVLGTLVPLAGLALIAWIALRRAMMWCRHGWVMTDHQLHIREGVFAPTTVSCSRRKLQSVEIEQGPIGRLFGYVTCHFGLAGDTMAVTGLTRADAEGLRAAVLESIAPVDFAEAQR